MKVIAPNFLTVCTHPASVTSSFTFVILNSPQVFVLNITNFLGRTFLVLASFLAPACRQRQVAHLCSGIEGSKDNNRDDILSKDVIPSLPNVLKDEVIATQEAMP